MPPAIHITTAEARDFPTLAQIQAAAMCQETISRVIFCEKPDSSHKQEHFALAELQRAALNSRCSILKASVQASKEIIAYAILRLEDGVTEQGPSTASMPTTVNVGLCQFWLGSLKQKHQRHMAGTEHAGEYLFRIRSQLCTDSSTPISVPFTVKRVLLRHF